MKLTTNDIFSIINSLKHSFCRLIIGKQSNYYISELIKKSIKKQKLTILSEISAQIKDLAVNEYGTHPIQTFIERTSSKEEITIIINAISSPSTFMKLCTDPNGTYVIQKIILFVSEMYRIQINSLILNNILSLSVDLCGVRVVQNFILTCENLQSLYYIGNIYNNNILYLGNDKYGNYAFQCYIKTICSNRELFNMISYEIYLNLFELSVNEYGYHIIDVYLDNITRNNKQVIYNTLYTERLIYVMYVNKYSRYVVNKIVKGFEDKDRYQILNELKRVKFKNVWFSFVRYY